MVKLLPESLTYQIAGRSESVNCSLKQRRTILSEEKLFFQQSEMQSFFGHEKKCKNDIGFCEYPTYLMRWPKKEEAHLPLRTILMRLVSLSVMNFQNQSQIEKGLLSKCSATKTLINRHFCCFRM